MEKTPFKFGRSSFAMVIPKAWAEKNGLQRKNLLYVNEDDSGNLVVSTKQGGKAEFEEVVTKETYTFIWRLIGFHYMYGTTRLRIYSKDGFSAGQVRAIEENVHRYYMGFEITSQSINDFVIEDMSNIKDTSIDKITVKIAFLISEMFKELLSEAYERSGKRDLLHRGAKIGGVDVAHAEAGSMKTGASYSSIDGIEELVNRYYLLGIRYLNMLKPGNIYLYLRALELMEDAADILVRFSKIDFGQARGVLESDQRLFETSAAAMKGDRKKIDEVFKMTEAISKEMRRVKVQEHIFEMLYDLTWSIAVIAEAGLIREKVAQQRENAPRP